MNFLNYDFFEVVTIEIKFNECGFMIIEFEIFLSNDDELEIDRVWTWSRRLWLKSWHVTSHGQFPKQPPQKLGKSSEMFSPVY